MITKHRSLNRLLNIVIGLLLVYLLLPVVIRYLNRVEFVCPPAIDLTKSRDIIHNYGRDLAFSDEKSGEVNIITQLPEYVVASNPSISPDNSRLAFSLTYRHPEIEVYPNRIVCVAEYSTGNVKQVDSGDNLYSYPSWYNNEALIIKQESKDGLNSIILYNYSLNNATTMVSNTTDLYAYPTAYPDVNKIVYITRDLTNINPNDAPYDNIYIMDMTTKSKENITKSRHHIINFAVLSPDRQYILFGVNNDGAHNHSSSANTETSTSYFFAPEVAFAHENSEIWIVRQDGTGMQRLLGNIPDGRATWSPDSKQIAYTTSNNNGVFIFTLETKELKQISKSGDGTIFWAGINR